MELGFELHEKQQEIYFSKTRFKVVAAGRRGGKSFLAAILLIMAVLEEYSRNNRKLTSNNVVWYVAPTYQQAKDIMWDMLKELAGPILAPNGIKEKELTLVAHNGRKIILKGSDRPDTLRGKSVHYLVLDEYADMKADVFDLILRPSLVDCQGDAMFIGTPKGKNHFYTMWNESGLGNWGPEWEAFHFCSLDNPLISHTEIEHARATMSKEAFEQEFMASFTAASGGAFATDDFEIIEKLPPGYGTTYMTVDPNGYKDTKGMVQSKLKRLDETAIAVVEVRQDGWYVKDMIHGRWGTRETSLKIIRAAQQYRPAQLGVENLDAIKPYLVDQMRRLNVFPDLVPLKHGGQKKTDRIIWALQGRSQNGRIKLLKGNWNQPLLNQLRDFPNPLAHDDLPDALAYIDQLATTVYHEECEVDDWEPVDDVAGY